MAGQTLLVYGDASAPKVRLLTDDNSPAPVANNAKIRLVNLLNGLDGTISLSADYVSVGDNVSFGGVSTPTSLVAGSGIRLELTTPLRPSALYPAAT